MSAKFVTRHSSRTLLVSNENSGGENDSKKNDETVQAVDKFQFNTRVDNFYEGRDNSLKKPWSRSRVLMTIAEIKDAKGDSSN